MVRSPVYGDGSQMGSSNTTAAPKTVIKPNRTDRRRNGAMKAAEARGRAERVG